MTAFWKALILLTVFVEIGRAFGLPGETATYAQAREFMRTRQLTRQETDPRVDPYRTFLMVGENATVSDSFLANYSRSQSGTSSGMNMVAPDFLYDPAGRRILFRSAVAREVDDISGVRLGRAPGSYPNEIDFNSALAPFTIRGHLIVDGDVYAHRCIELPESTIHSEISR